MEKMFSSLDDYSKFSNRFDKMNSHQLKILEQLMVLSDEERLEIFNEFCKSCGCDDPDCQCWNDD